MDIKLNKDDVIIRQGDNDSTYLYVVVKGELEATRATDKAEVHLTSYKVGDTFGEVSMLLDKERSATIRVTSKEAVLKRLDKKEFLKEIKKDPQIAWNILEKLASQTQKFDELREQFLRIYG